MASTASLPALPPPDPIVQLGLSFWGAKALLSAVELRLFTHLADRALSVAQVCAELKLAGRGVRDWLDVLMALGFLERKDGSYSATPLSATYLDEQKDTYVGGLLEMANDRLYPLWGRLTEGLKTGHPQSEANSDRGTFNALYRDPERMRRFLHSMTGLSRSNAAALCANVDWSHYRTVADIGCAEGCIPVQLAKTFRHLEITGMDLAEVRPVFDHYVGQHGLSERVHFLGGDFFSDELPPADVYILGHILHDWNEEQRLILLKKVFDRLPATGACVVYECFIDDDRQCNIFGMLMSLNMLLETHGGADFTAAECRQWMSEVGFTHFEQKPLSGVDAMLIGYKR